MLVLALPAIALIVGFVAWVFNPLVSARNNVRSAWSDVEVQLTKRAELTPQLVAVVEGYADHESDVFAAVTKARERALGLMGPRGADAVDRQLEGPLKQLIALGEAYPDLKANQNFNVLSHNLVMIEDDLAASRRFYNGHVRRYEDLRLSFPRSLVSGALGFDKESFFRADLDDTRPPQIDLDPVAPPPPAPSAPPAAPPALSDVSSPEPPTKDAPS